MKEKTSLVFTGDIGFDRYMQGKWDDAELISQEIYNFLHSADHVVANVEGPLADVPENTVKNGTAQLLHTMNPAVTNVLSEMKADIWNICNNHIMDAGAYGVEATLKEAQKLGVTTVGAGMNLKEAMKPVILREAGGIGIFSVGYRRGCKPASDEKAGCLMWNDTDSIKAVIAEIKKTCRWCVMIAHAGEEFTSLPSPYTRKKYLDFLSMGVDVIVAHHPHVPMNYETVGDKAIFYSLGNFIFDTDYQRAQFNTDIGVLLKLSFTESEFSFEPMGIKILRGEEHVVKGELPRIFRNVEADEYELLAPLAAKMLVSAMKRRQIYLEPDKFTDAAEAEWKYHFGNPMRAGRIPGEALDFIILNPLAEKEKEKAWQKSRLTDVVEYILEQI